jgi:hypothetical protein
MLRHNNAIVGSAPQNEQELNAWLHTWVCPPQYARRSEIEDQVHWLASVAHISPLQACATLCSRSPRVYDSLMFSMLGNGYGEAARCHEVDLVACLIAAAERS